MRCHVEDMGCPPYEVKGGGVSGYHMENLTKDIIASVLFGECHPAPSPLNTSSTDFENG